MLSAPVLVLLLQLFVFGPPMQALPEVIPNDNRVPGGRVANGATELHLVAKLAAWRPDLDVDSLVTIQAFAEAESSPRIPGPLLRVEQGTTVRVTITNDVPDSTLVVYGLTAGARADDTVHVRPGTRRDVTFTAGAPGTYLYWGTTSGKGRPQERNARDGQMTGAIVIDPRGVAPDPDERFFVITIIDILPDTTKPPPHEDIWELAINGLSWPHSEPIRHDVGDTIRWRWLNGSYLSHPMHLHGFHFRVVSKGDGRHDVHFAPGEVREVVTEFMMPGSTFAMEWVPTRPGNWLFHCHMAAHITPFPDRPDSIMAHDRHDVAQHARQGMAGLVLGIQVRDPAAGDAPEVRPSQRLRLIAQQAAPVEPRNLRATGYVLVRGPEPAPDSVDVPGQPLLLTRGETTAITVINRTDELTTVHWHGMELESIYDGVAGWSGAGGNLAPLLARGDSFTVSFTPPRAGTFIYHTHMDETMQLGTGGYGPLIVLEPGESFDPATDIVLMVGRAVNGDVNAPSLNGRSEPAPRELKTGTTYRLRLVNILNNAPLEVELRSDAELLEWRRLAEDGATLPPALQRVVAARIDALGVGETYDMMWTPSRPMSAVLTLFNTNDDIAVSQVFHVR